MSDYRYGGNSDDDVVTTSDKLNLRITSARVCCDRLISTGLQKNSMRIKDFSTVFSATTSSAVEVASTDLVASVAATAEKEVFSINGSHSSPKSLCAHTLRE